MSAQVSAERIEFLRDIFHGAIENYGQGWFITHEYRWEDLEDKFYATVESNAIGDDDTLHRIDISVIRKGLRVIAQSVLKDFDGETVLSNRDTGERLYLSESRKRAIIRADRTRDENCELDVNDYLAIVECGLFGKVVYA